MSEIRDIASEEDCTGKMTVLLHKARIPGQFLRGKEDQKDIIKGLYCNSKQ